MATMGWVDRVALSVSPRWALRRMRARVATELLARHYEAASTGRRTQGWRRSSGDANLALTGGLSKLRDHARDLVRNNPHAESALSTIADHAVGWGIVAKPRPASPRASAIWREWAGTTACDADGRHDFYGLQKLAMRTIVEAGEVLIRRRIRRPEDGLPIPIQVQVLEPDYLDMLKPDARLPNGGRIIHGVEFDALGRRVAYWLYPEHPGSEQFMGAMSSRRVPAEGVLHVFRQTRPGQVRGPSWFAPVMLTLKDFDEYADAQLMKQKVAACLAVITTDPDGSATPLGVATTGDDSTSPEWDQLGPGAVVNAPPGRDVTIVDPPSVGDYGAYSEVTLRAIATGLGVTYEDLTGDYTDLPFSAARMSRLRHWARVEDWRWRMIVPQFCDPVWGWAMQAAAITGAVSSIPSADWTAPPLPMIDPEKESLANTRLIRSGLKSLSEILRESGYDPESVLTEIASDFGKLDELELILDSDPRKTTQAGQFQSEPKAEEQPAAPTPVRKKNGHAGHGATR